MKMTYLAALSALLLSTASVCPAQTASRPPGTPGTGVPAAAAAAPGTDYRLVPGDKLRIEVYKDATLSQSLQVRPDGKITLPLIGDVNAAGSTSSELREALTASLKEYNSNPIVTVIVVETVLREFFVMGEVNAAGTYTLRGQVSVLQALAMAGGFKDFAKTKDIKILRKTFTGVETLKFNYKDAVKGRGPQLFVQPGDTIIVP